MTPPLAAPEGAGVACALAGRASGSSIGVVPSPGGPVGPALETSIGGRTALPRLKALAVLAVTAGPCRPEGLAQPCALAGRAREQSLEARIGDQGGQPRRQENHCFG